MENINEIDRKYLYDDDDDIIEEVSIYRNSVTGVLSRQNSKRYLR